MGIVFKLSLVSCSSHSYLLHHSHIEIRVFESILGRNRDCGDLWGGSIAVSHGRPAYYYAKGSLHVDMHMQWHDTNETSSFICFIRNISEPDRCGPIVQENQR